MPAAAASAAAASASCIGLSNSSTPCASCVKACGPSSGGPAAVCAADAGLLCSQMALRAETSLGASCSGDGPLSCLRPDTQQAAHRQCVILQAVCQRLGSSRGRNDSYMGLRKRLTCRDQSGCRRQQQDGGNRADRVQHVVLSCQLASAVHREQKYMCSCHHEAPVNWQMQKRFFLVHEKALLQCSAFAEADNRAKASLLPAEATARQVWAVQGSV